MPVHVQTFHDADTATFTHVVTDPSTQKTAIIDSVLGYDQFSGVTNTASADEVVAYVNERGLSVDWLLETHIHADHISASHYLQKKLGGKIGIGARIKDVLELWVPIFNTAHDTDVEGGQFDCLFDDGDIINLGNLHFTVMHTPGHTPACSSYLIEDAVFVGDTLFMPDVGTARTDFPGGSAESMYESAQKILSLDDATRIYLCHDYPPCERPISWETSVKEQKAENVMVREGISKAAYVKQRNDRDHGKAIPHMLLPSIQANLRAGDFGAPEVNGIQYIKIPVDKM